MRQDLRHTATKASVMPKANSSQAWVCRWGSASSSVWVEVLLPAEKVTGERSCSVAPSGRVEILRNSKSSNQAVPVQVAL